MKTALNQKTLEHIYNRVAPRYDLQHSLLTAGFDERGRTLLAEHAISRGDTVLDCGAGTGSAGLLAADKTGASGSVVLIDSSAGMLDVADERAVKAHVHGRMDMVVGNMLQLPFKNDSFDVVLSAYSMCPVYDPIAATTEAVRVTKPGGRIGIAHSTEPESQPLKWLANEVENIVWHFPSISLGCRSVTVRPTLEQCDCRIVFEQHFGVPVWPFLVLIAEKPAV